MVVDLAEALDRARVACETAMEIARESRRVHEAARQTRETAARFRAEGVKALERLRDKKDAA